MLMTWEHIEYTPHIAPPELVDAAFRKVPMSTAAANSGGVSHLRRAFRRVFLYPPSGRGTTISPCGFIPLVSPGLHNPVKRNDQRVFTCGLKRGGKGEQRVECIKSVREQQMRIIPAEIK